MSAMLSFSFSVLALTLFFGYGQSQLRRFEYKLSFKGPHLVQRDKSIPFWEYYGDALAGDEGIRLTPSLRSKKGSVWTKNKLEAKNWEIEAAVRVSGRGRLGADGMAIWFTEEKGQRDNIMENSVFGSADNWKGLGIFLDSFDNDNQQNNPYIMAVSNDGTKSYDHQNDGSSQHMGGCMRDFRNKPYPIRVRIEYQNQVLSVKVHNGITSTNNPNDYEICMTAVNVVLPQSGYIGISAATGGLADDHDVLYVVSHSIIDQSAEAYKMSEDERQKYEKEFKDYQDELTKAKSDYDKEHPNQKNDPYNGLDEEDWFQPQYEKELKQIFDGQKYIHDLLNMLSRRLDEMMGKQEMTLSRVNSLPVGQQFAQQPPQGGQQQPPAQIATSPIQRQEVDRLINNQNALLQQLGDMKYVINDIQQKAGSMSQGGGGGGGTGGAMQDQMALHEIKDRLNNVANDMKNLISRPAGVGSCPPTTSNCLSPTLFIVAMIVQFVLTIGYMVYRSTKEAQAKKFY